jgi:hypothetical protein
MSPSTFSSKEEISVTTTPSETFVDFLGNVLTIPAGENATMQMLSTEQAHGRRKTVPDAKVEDWSRLKTSQQISLWRRKSFVAWGIVDEVMPDASAVWLFIPKEFRRTLVHSSDGLTISLAES